MTQKLRHQIVIHISASTEEEQRAQHGDATNPSDDEPACAPQPGGALPGRGHWFSAFGLDALLDVRVKFLEEQEVDSIPLHYIDMRRKHPRGFTLATLNRILCWRVDLSRAARNEVNGDLKGGVGCCVKGVFGCPFSESGCVFRGDLGRRKRSIARQRTRAPTAPTLFCPQRERRELNCPRNGPQGSLPNNITPLRLKAHSL